MCSDYRQHRLEASAPAWFGRIWRQMKVSVTLYMTRLTLLQLHPFLHMGQQGELDRGNMGKQDWRNSLSLLFSALPQVRDYILDHKLNELPNWQ
jgi:hypothetical protein